jgi:hypothetical protein
MRARAGEVFRLHPAGIYQPSERALYGRATTIDGLGDLALPQEAPTEFVGVCPQETEHLKVASLKAPVYHGAGRNDGIAAVRH